MQAGLTKRPLTLREIFSSRIVFLISDHVAVVFVYPATSVILHDPGIPLAA